MMNFTVQPCDAPQTQWWSFIVSISWDRTLGTSPIAVGWQSDLSMCGMQKCSLIMFLFHYYLFCSY